MGMGSSMETLILATRNRHKVKEIQQILKDTARCLSLDDFSGVPPLIEDGNTFEANATRKAVQLARWLMRAGENSGWVLADDSGLEVDALLGAPGVHSARFAAENPEQGNTPDEENNSKLLSLLAGVPPAQRTARFRCVIALTPLLRATEKSNSPVCEADDLELATRLFQGACEGRIIENRKGSAGFGYDPLFIPNGFGQTFGELGEDVKNRISHRSKALEGLQRAQPF
jgi:XTP/dITP diphosphohydrolase